MRKLRDIKEWVEDTKARVYAENRRAYYERCKPTPYVFKPREQTLDELKQQLREEIRRELQEEAYFDRQMREANGEEYPGAWSGW